MRKYEVPRPEISSERLAELENQKRLKRGLPPEGFGDRKPILDLEKLGVYTYADVVLPNGMPLIVRGTLTKAMEERKKALEGRFEPEVTPALPEDEAHFDPSNEATLRALGFAGFGISSEERSAIVGQTEGEVDEQLAA